MGWEKDNETGWDPGHFAAVFVPGKHLLQQQIQRNYKGLKLTVCMCSWGQMMDTRFKKTKPNCHLWKARSKSRVSGAKVGYCSCPLLTTPPKGCSWKKSYDKPRQCIKRQRHHFADRGPYSQSYGFSSSVYGCESWTIKKAEHQRIDAFELWSWRRLLRVS